MSDIESVSASTYIAVQPAAAAQATSDHTHEETSSETKASTESKAETPVEAEAATASAYNTVGSASNSTVRGAGVSVVV